MANSAFETNFDRYYVASKGSKEWLLDKFDLDEIIPSIRVHSVHFLLVRFIATLESSNEDMFGVFNDDTLYWNRNFWKDLLLIYQQNDRSFLFHDKTSYLILKTVFQILALTRMSTVHSKNQYERLVNLVSNLENSIVVLDGEVDIMKEHLDPQSSYLHRSINHLKEVM